jgi:tetratricopeptide (TPR) repeat protein
VNATWADRSWTAQTYYNLAAGQRDAARGPSPSKGQTQAATHSISTKEYFTKARDALRQLLEAAAADSNYAPGDNALLAAKLHLGECYRELGEYELALNTFSSILKEKETSLSVQRAAALTYQERGENENYQWLERAIHGGYQVKSTGKNRIWGWIKLAQVAERAARTKATYRDAFFEARLNATRCRYLIGMKHQGADREQHLAKAKQSIRVMMQLYPNFGSERWRSEFDALLKKIQTAAGKEPVGLQEFTAPRSP